MYNGNHLLNHYVFIKTISSLVPIYNIIPVYARSPQPTWFTVARPQRRSTWYAVRHGRPCFEPVAVILIVCFRGWTNGWLKGFLLQKLWNGIISFAFVKDSPVISVTYAKDDEKESIEAPFLSMKRIN